MRRLLELSFALHIFNATEKANKASQHLHTESKTTGRYPPSLRLCFIASPHESSHGTLRLADVRPVLEEMRAHAQHEIAAGHVPILTVCVRMMRACLTQIIVSHCTVKQFEEGHPQRAQPGTNYGPSCVLLVSGGSELLQCTYGHVAFCMNSSNLPP